MKAANILVAADFSKYSELLIKAAVKIGKGDECKIHILHVEEDLFRIKHGHALTCMDRELIPIIERYHSSMMCECSKKMKELVHKIPEDMRGESVILEGHAAESIINYVNEHKIDLLVIGSHGHTDLASMLLGSTTDKVSRKANCSVFIVRDKSRNS